MRPELVLTKGARQDSGGWAAGDPRMRA